MGCCFGSPAIGWLRLLRKEELVKSQGGVLRVVGLTFELPEGESLHSLGFDLGLGDVVRISFPGVRRPRKYSPVSDPAKKGEFSIVVRVHEEHGVVSKKLGAMEEGEVAEVELPVPWRTKQRLVVSPPSEKRAVAILSFGVGITECAQLVRSELLDPAVERVLLVWALRSEKEKGMMDKAGILREVLVKGSEKGSTSDKERFAVHYAFSRSPENSDDQQNHHYQRPTPDLLRTIVKSEGMSDMKTAVLCVGTKGMMKEGYKMWKEACGFDEKLLTTGWRYGRAPSPLWTEIDRVEKNVGC